MIYLRFETLIEIWDLGTLEEPRGTLRNPEGPFEVPLLKFVGFFWNAGSDIVGKTYLNPASGLVEKPLFSADFLNSGSNGY